MFNSLSPIIKRNIGRIIPFGVIWLFFGWVFLFVEYAALGGFDNVSATAISPDFKILVFASVAVTVVGLLIGVIELVWLNRVLSSRSFKAKIVYKFIFYLTFLFLIILVAFPLAASMELKVGIFDGQVWEKYIVYLTSITNVSTFVQMGVSLLVSLLYAEINENIGHNVLFNFFTGKYHRPKEEKRIFMFLDMKSSTTIAEQLGHIKYFELLKEYYNSLSDAIIRYNGEIYQYIGDEIVISWQFDKGLKNNNCILSFFAMREDLNNRAKYFEETFGVIPSFKAGLHYGMVTTGEIGALKMEIIFTGDVLNTTARIQSLCNEFKVDILLSKELVLELQPIKGYDLKALGMQDLRGRKETTELYTLS